ncbi:ORN1 [Auxenochlorella protothecoides x Auxenochlorella symbiontica]
MPSSNAFMALQDLGDALPAQNTPRDHPGRLKLPLVWLDLEMSGLDPAQDAILQVAVILTNGTLTEEVQGPEIVIYQPVDVLEGMNEWCQEHHTSSGLKEAVTKSTIDLAAAERQVLEFLDKHILANHKAQLAGSSVHTDLAFLRVHMPRLAERLDHRIVDVTTVVELAKRWKRGVFQARPRGRNKHTAMADIEDSIAMLKYFRTSFFTT